VTEQAKEEWATPQAFFDELDKEFEFTLDVCAAAWNHKCYVYFDKSDDGLSMDWRNEVCWMNPPYTRGIINKWMKKAWESSLAGATVVCLVPSRTSAAWFQDYALKGELRFPRGRLSFVHQNGSTGQCRICSTVVIFRPPGDKNSTN